VLELHRGNINPFEKEIVNMIGNVALSEWIIPGLILIFLLFGARKMPELARALGRSLSEFKKGTRDIIDDLHSEPNDKPEKPEHTEQDKKSNSS
jgi:sec-independent protein translocase protein TatA